MNRFGQPERSVSVAVWLFLVAGLVFGIVIVGGLTRLTGSGLSITEWMPLVGMIPPLSEADWQEAFEKYRAIPQYQLVNAGMSMAEFQAIYWWEWIHRQLGRFIGMAVALPFFVFLAARHMDWLRRRGIPALPGRLVWRGWALVMMVGLQGAVGWWMVSSGLEARVDVAPERLAFHLGLALLIFSALIWTGLEALNGPERSESPSGWTVGASLLLGLVFVQCLLGALVAGGKAGMVYTDWPLMNGAFLAPVDWGQGALAFLHDQALTQFNHRMTAYSLMLAVVIYAVQAWRWRLAEGAGASAWVVLAAVMMQAGLGIATLMQAVPVWLGVLHQAGAAVVLAAATVNLWLVMRSRPRRFIAGPRSMGL